MPPGNHPRGTAGLGPEAYLFSKSQDSRPDDGRLPRRRAYSAERRTAISAVAAGGSCIMRVKALLVYETFCFQPKLGI